MTTKATPAFKSSSKLQIRVRAHPASNKSTMECDESDALLELADVLCGEEQAAAAPLPPVCSQPHLSHPHHQQQEQQKQQQNTQSQSGQRQQANLQQQQQQQQRQPGQPLQRPGVLMARSGFARPIQAAGGNQSQPKPSQTALQAQKSDACRHYVEELTGLKVCWGYFTTVNSASWCRLQYRALPWCCAAAAAGRMQSLLPHPHSRWH